MASASQIEKPAHTFPPVTYSTAFDLKEEIHQVGLLMMTDEIYYVVRMYKKQVSVAVVVFKIALTDLHWRSDSIIT